MKLSDRLYKISHWETWHYLAKYIPLFPAWVWFCFRSRSVWFFTPSNPSLTFGGFEGESKSEMYALLPEGSFPKSIVISPGTGLTIILAKMNANGLHFPVAVKPDAGMMGFMFRKIENSSELERYLAVMSVNFILQELIDYPLEVSVFYYRYPGQSSGYITGFIRKEFLEVTGDGESTLRKLIENYDRARFRKPEFIIKHANKLDSILPKGKRFVLSDALNLSRGGKLVSLEKEKSSDLVKVFDNLSLHAGDFYYGRYDLKCRSVEDLKKGENFSILEYNGCGAEPHHIYGNGNTLMQAYSIILSHWQKLFEISRTNRKNGLKPWPFWKGYLFLRNAKKHFRRLKLLDRHFEL